MPLSSTNNSGKAAAAKRTSLGQGTACSGRGSKPILPEEIKEIKMNAPSETRAAIIPDS
jgi:hypothetical protein